MADDLYTLTIGELGELIRKREIKSADIVNSYAKRITEADRSVSAYLYTDFDEAAKPACRWFAQHLLNA